MSEDVTVGVERTSLTEVVVASTATEYVTVNLTLEEFNAGLTSLVDTLQGTVAVVNTCCLDDTTSDSGNLTTSEECVTYHAAVHLYVCYIHTTVVDISATEYTSTIIESVSAVARPSLVVQFLLIVVRAHLYMVEVGICCRYAAEVTITNKALVQSDVCCTEHGTTLTTTVGVTLDGWDTVDKAGAVFLTDDNVCLTKDVTCWGCTDFTNVIAYTSSPTAAIDVTCRTALDIGICRSDEWLAEVVSRNVVFVVHRTYRSCSIEVLCYSTSKQSDVGSSVNVASILGVGVTQTTTVGVSTVTAAVIHISADVSAFFDDDVGVVFLAGSGYC